MQGTRFGAFLPEKSQLRIGLSDLSDKQIDDYRHGDIQFLVHRKNNAIVTLWKFGDQPWSDAPVDAVAAKKLGQLDMTRVANLPVEMMLVDLHTHITKAVREIDLTVEQTNKLRDAIWYQLDKGFKQEDFDFLMTYSAEELAKRAEA